MTICIIFHTKLMKAIIRLLTLCRRIFIMLKYIRSKPRHNVTMPMQSFVYGQHITRNEKALQGIIEMLEHTL